VVHDPGAWAEPPLEARITWRVTRPELEPKSEEERSAGERLADLMDRVKESVARRKQRSRGLQGKKDSPSP
jgi:hypothetical protein